MPDLPAHHRSRPLVAAFVVFLLGAVAAASLIWRLERDDLQDQRAQASNVMIDHGHTLQRGIERALSAAYALEALLRQGNGAISNFDAVGHQMLPLYPGVSSVSLAPGGVIRSVVPLPGNEKAIGLDLLGNAATRKEASIARDTGKLTLAGPFKLENGKLAAIGRLPVFLDGAKRGPSFWGFINVEIGFPEALEVARLPELAQQGFAYKLWRMQPASGARQIIAASSRAALNEPLEHTLEVPNATWTLGIEPVKGWGDPLRLTLKAALALIFSLLLALLTKLVIELKSHKQGLEDLVAQRTAEVQASQTRYWALVQSANDAIITSDSAGKIVGWNQGAEAIFGYTQAEVNGQPLTLLMPRRYHQRHLEGMKRLLSGAEPHIIGKTVELTGLHKNMGEFPLELSLAKWQNAEGYFVTSIIRDVTERVRTQDELRRMNELLEQRVAERTNALQVANRELEAFSYSVSHDLRAPLRAIGGFSHILQEQCASQIDLQCKDLLRRVSAAAEKMGQLIDDLLKLSKMSRQEMQVEPVDLSALAREVVEELKAEAPERNAEWVIAAPVTAQGDRGLLKVVLQNLIGNAWKYSSRRDRARIEFGVAERDGRPVYCVRDNGAGFDMAYADKLFRAFQRLHSPAEFPGTGIGLATVARIVHRHGGQVWAEGKVGHGSGFYFTL
ncbi:MAG: PAS domain S-box protein [Betaproteobacteria bacterium]|nr:PAS domain S-box protein [Betaproteobacteria bacterium]